MSTTKTTWVTETLHEAVVPSGEITTGDNVKLDVKGLRAAIPAHCLKPSTLRSFSFVFRDLAFYLAFLCTALYVERTTNNYVVSFLNRFIVFPYAAGIALTGLWVLGHEAGHGAFSTNQKVANTVGFIIHSALMSPYFAWRSSHGRHHQYANNVAIDLNYVPPSREEYRTMFGNRSKRGQEALQKKFEAEGKESGIHDDDVFEDAPFVVLLRIILQQVIGWYWYLLTHITAGPESSPKRTRGWWDNSHFLPNSSLFRDDEFWNILLSDIGLLVMMGVIYTAGKQFGFMTVLWTYGIPLLWVNHWIVMITYLHHTHTDLPKYAPESWTYLRGALATVDRDPGFILRHMTHHIIDLHVIHHLFPRIPHYHAAEATNAIKPLLGDQYHVDKTSYWGALWTAFTDCQWVEPDKERTAKASVYSSSMGDSVESAKQKVIDETGVLWYRGGRMPGPAVINSRLLEKS
ncbi:fatty acid desaturase-domain-containing protein [Xylariaceae sp. FL1019]|nr:fatty acid desaturase-domain-containing protein [Xylariaceae sp. FL1019]